MHKASCVAEHIMDNTYIYAFMYAVHGVHMLKHVHELFYYVINMYKW